MSEDSMSDKDLEVENVEEGANIRVVQSSMHASVIQSSILKASEIKKEIEKDEEKKIEEPPAEPVEEVKVEEKIEEKQHEEIKIEENLENTNQKSEQIEEKNENLNDENLQEDEKIDQKAALKNKIISSHLQEIFEEKKKVRPQKLDIEKRFYDYKDKVNQKIQNLQEEKKNQEIKSCTFHPKTKISKQEDRKFSHFLDHMEKVDKQRKDNLERKKNEKEESENPKKDSFKPTLSKGTLKITSKNKSSSDLHEKLYKESSELKKKKEADSQSLLEGICPFKPVVNKKSTLLKREGETNTRLYEEAKKKKNKAEEIPEKKKNEKLISDESENIVRERFIKQMTTVLNSPQPDKKLDFSEFLTLLENLQFIHKDPNFPKFQEERDLGKKAWNSLENESEPSVPIEKVKEFLLNLMNLSKEQPSGIKKKIHLEYLKFYENRKKGIETKQSSPKSQEFLFKPVLNEVTETLAQQIKNKRLENFNETKPEKVLELIEKKSKLAIDEKRKTKVNEIPSECTFKPQTKRGPKLNEESFTENGSLASDYFKLITERKEHRTDLLYNFSKLEQEKKEKMARTLEDIEIEQNMSECTFTPCLEKKLVKIEKPKEIEKVVNVIDKLRKDKLLKKEQENNEKRFLIPDFSENKVVHKKSNAMNQENNDETPDYITETVRQFMKMDTLRSYYNEDFEDKKDF